METDLLSVLKNATFIMIKQLLKFLLLKTLHSRPEQIFISLNTWSSVNIYWTAYPRNFQKNTPLKNLFSWSYVTLRSINVKFLLLKTLRSRPEQIFISPNFLLSVNIFWTAYPLIFQNHTPLKNLFSWSHVILHSINVTLVSWFQKATGTSGNIDGRYKVLHYLHQHKEMPMQACAVSVLEKLSFTHRIKELHNFYKTQRCYIQKSWQWSLTWAKILLPSHST